MIHSSFLDEAPTQKPRSSGRLRFTLHGLLCLLVLLLAGCGPAAPTATPPPPPATAVPPTATTAPPSPAPPTVGATVVPTVVPAVPTNTVVPPGDFVNPVLHSDFADPAVIKAGDTYYAYATNANSHNIQLARSPDLVHWELLTDAMPALPKWAQLGGSYVWAPDVIQIGPQYVMYYTARDKQANVQCIGVATSDKPEGKFKDSSDHALVCQPDLGGDIDASPFRDGDKLYLYWKNDGNCCGMPTHLYGQELAPDGLSLVGSGPTDLTQNTAVWEGNVTEGPYMFKHDTKYYLFFSANDYAGLKYAVGYALCDAPTGPCTQAAENPILKTTLNQPPVIGPGGQSLIQIGNQTWMVYHAWEVSSQGLKTSRRFMWLDKVDWPNDKPVVEGPTTAPQPMP